MMSKKGFGKFLLGASIGAGLGLLFSPKTGKENQKILKNKIEELVEKTKELDSEEVKKNIQEKIDEITKEISELDKEKALKLAKTKAKEIKAKADDLLDYIVEKGTPVLEQSAKKVKEKAITVTKEILNKLEQEEK